MGDYNRGRSGWRSGGGFGWGGRGRWDSDRKELFRATCAECGKNCEVPFRPTWERPVYCSDCFRDVDSWRSDRDSDRRDFGRDRNDRWGRRDSNFWEKRMYEAVCDQCGNDCEVPFKPSSDKPIYCSDCFVREDKPRAGKWPDYKAEFEKLEAKLDMIIKFLNISEVKKEVVKIKLPKEIKEEPIEEATDNNNPEEIKEDVIKKEKKVSTKEKTVKKTVKK